MNLYQVEWYTLVEQLQMMSQNWLLTLSTMMTLSTKITLPSNIVHVLIKTLLYSTVILEVYEAKRKVMEYHLDLMKVSL